MIAAVGVFFLAIIAGIVVLATAIVLLARRKKRD